MKNVGLERSSDVGLLILKLTHDKIERGGISRDLPGGLARSDRVLVHPVLFIKVPTSVVEGR
jgi:hypothetical protein